MFTHVMVGAHDIQKSKIFYDAVLGALGVKPGFADDKGRVIYVHDHAMFMITSPINGEPATHANGGTIGFRAASPEQADAWHAAGVAHGGTSCEDAPGYRESPIGALYLAYLRDPAGNKLCALHRPA
ncbi:bleomycin resistance protein [Sphingomonas sp. MM-1]|uniref:VOC family protein n=1 Tax=Sphingomonas sp. MM-1 TaxID=745310 RepID=UPI0002C0DB5E|nr:VOC family protein [Sphingomonas sp. MM-1]AGH50237.1 bleomycin resistance protein [Sphingomonas sp. MM-1]